MAEKHTVAMFIQEDGERKQVGWASPAENGTRTFEFSPGYSDRDRRPALKNVSFEDDELSQKIAAEQEASGESEVVVEPAPEAPAEETNNTEPVETVTEESYPQAGDEGKDSAPIEVVPNEELATEPVTEDVVEVEGGEVTEVAEEAPVEDDAEAKREQAIQRQKEQQARRQQNRNKQNKRGN